MANLIALASVFSPDNFFKFSNSAQAASSKRNVNSFFHKRMINELILKNNPNSWLRNGFKKQCFIILFAVLYTGSQTSFKGLFISLFSILKDTNFL